jgi:hypothetical protein
MITSTTVATRRKRLRMLYESSRYPYQRQEQTRTSWPARKPHTLRAVIAGSHAHASQQGVTSWVASCRFSRASTTSSAWSADRPGTRSSGADTAEHKASSDVRTVRSRAPHPPQQRTWCAHIWCLPAVYRVLKRTGTRRRNPGFNSQS